MVRIPIFLCCFVFVKKVVTSMYFLDEPHEGYISNVEGVDRSAGNNNGPFLLPYSIINAKFRVQPFISHSGDEDGSDKGDEGENAVVEVSSDRNEPGEEQKRSSDDSSSSDIDDDAPLKPRKRSRPPHYLIDAGAGDSQAAAQGRHARRRQ